MSVVVGGQGSSQGVEGYNGGGFGAGGAGGGATDLRRATATGQTGDYLASRDALVVAGGAGGNGNSNTVNYPGGAGGVPTGGNGTGPYTVSGATQTGVGTGYAPGAANAGGGGSNGGSSGNGGGGGYYGGAGNYEGSGSGGSSWVAPGSLVGLVTYSVATAAGNGALTITPVYTAPTITTFNNPSGAVGSTLIITGTNLGGATSVRFGELPARPSTISVNVAGTRLTVTVPVLASTNTVSVTTM